MSLFIQLEGPDGSGKSTISKAFAVVLRELGFDVVETVEPSTGPYGVEIRELLKGDKTVGPLKLAELFAKDRLEHAERVVLPALREGKTVLSDRGLLSSLAYQCGGMGIDAVTVLGLNRYAPRPDLIIVLDVPEVVCEARRRARGKPEIFDDGETQQRVRSWYRCAGSPIFGPRACTSPVRGFTDTNIVEAPVTLYSRWAGDADDEVLARAAEDTPESAAYRILHDPVVARVIAERRP